MTMNLLERIEKALSDFTSGRASMHVPPLDTDVDMVLTDCQSQLTALTSQLESVVAENAALKGALNKIAFTYSLSPHIHEMTTIAAPATDAFLAEVRASAIPDEATERDLFEEWVMEKIFISKTTLEGLRTDDGYRNSTLSGRDYNGMWSQWKSIRADQLRQEAK